MEVARLVCLDTVMLDVAFEIEDLPERGGDALAQSRTMSAGGGFNVMSAARRQGLSVAYLGQLGRGPLADLARHTLEDEGIDLLTAPSSPLDIGVCVVLVDAEAERTFVTSPGAELTLSATDLTDVAWAPGDVVYLSGYDVVYPELARVIVPWLKGVSDRVRVSFDPGPRTLDIAPDVLDLVLSRTDWLLCNAREATHLTTRDDPLRALHALHERGDFAGVVVRLGASGCLVSSGEETLRAEGFAVQALDSNGAGDVHNGVVLASLANGEPLSVVVRRANAAAALSVTRFGPATGPTREELDAFLRARDGEGAVSRVESYD